MKKSLLTLFAAAALILPATMSAKGYQSVLVSKTDNTTLAIQGSQGMKATAMDNILRFTTPDEAYIEIPLNEVTGWEYSDGTGDHEWTAIDGVEAEADVTLTRTATGISIANLPDNSVVTLTALSGITVKHLIASGTCTISFEGLQTGVYMLSFNNQTIKIAVTR